MIGAHGRVYHVGPGQAADLNRLVAFDIAGRSIAWAVPGRFYREPALARGVIYVANGTQLEARRESDGTLLWSWTPPEADQSPFDPRRVPSNIVVTDNLVFVSTSSRVYAVGIDSHQKAWSFPRPGRLALSPRGVLYIVTQGDQADGSVVAINLQ